MHSKIVFMGTPNISAHILQSLIDEGANVVMAVCQPDKKTGRSQKLVACPVKELAQKHNIPVFQPDHIKKEYQPIVDTDCDLIVTCAYGQIVPQEVLDAPKHGCVNLHASILPEYRGAAPIQRAIMDGKDETGMSLMKMEAGMDTGPVCGIVKVAITDEDNNGRLFDKMAQAGSEVLLKNLDALLKGTAVFHDQDHSKATYAAKISREEEALDLKQDDKKIFNTIRALSPTPGAYVMAKNKKLKILEARYLPGEVKEPDEFWQRNKKEILLSLKNGSLLLESVQMEGKPVMDAKSFVNGQGRSLIGTKAGE